jgi:hypothetical protein
MKKKDKVYMVRFSEEDWKLINKIAKKNGTWAATWIREVVIRELIKMGKRKEGESKIREIARWE